MFLHFCLYFLLVLALLKATYVSRSTLNSIISQRPGTADTQRTRTDAHGPLGPQMCSVFADWSRAHSYWYRPVPGST